jgi:hypothetical protein
MEFHICLQRYSAGKQVHCNYFVPVISFALQRYFTYSNIITEINNNEIVEKMWLKKKQKILRWLLAA